VERRRREPALGVKISVGKLVGDILLCAADFQAMMTETDNMRVCCDHCGMLLPIAKITGGKLLGN